MRIVDLIEKKREGQAHTPAELERLVQGYVRGEVPDYQVAAWLMAVCWRGMLPDEASTLTQVMAASGAQLDLSTIGRPVADKHFTGGTIDKLESFTGIRVDLDANAFVRQLHDIGIVMSGQSADLAPADGKLY